MTKKERTAEEEAEARRSALAELLSNLSIGLTDEQARIEMGLEINEYDALKSELYEQETSRLKRASAHEHFVDYKIAQRRILGDLETLATKAEETGNLGTALGALKASSDIQDRILKTGQDLGVIGKRAEGPQRHLHLHTGSLTEIREALAKDVKRIEGMMRDERGILDIDHGPLHRPGEAVIDADVVEPVSTAGKPAVYAGRRVVKEPPPPG